MLEQSDAERRALVRWLQECEAARPGAEGIAEAAQVVCRKLSARFSQLLTGYGTQALVARALYLAKTEHEALSRLRVGPGGRGCPDGLREALEAAGEDEGREAATALLANVLELLAIFIGEALVVRCLSDVWIELPRATTGLTSAEETR